MDSTWQILQEHLPQALIDTAYMVVVSAVVGVVLGSLVGLLLYLTENRLFHPNHVLNSVVGFIVNAIRSLPFLILLVVLIPVVQALIGDPYTPTGGRYPRSRISRVSVKARSPKSMTASSKRACPRGRPRGRC